MILWDVNILVYAFRSDSPLHSEARNCVEGTLSEAAAFLYCPSIAASFLRLVTNARIFLTPSDLGEGWMFLDYLERRPSAYFADIDERTYALFRHLTLVGGSRGNDVPDALLAETALRHDALLVTADTALSRFPGLSIKIVGKS